MNTPMNCTSEIQRLMTLLPETVRSHISIFPSPNSPSDLISTTRDRPLNYHIQINFNGWQCLNCDQRNLLFWHEVARLQGRGVQRSSRDLVILCIGTIALLAELLTQNLLGMVTTLTITGLASYYFYQQHYGESALRAASAADRNAIEFAIQFGYSFPEAYDSLCSALQYLVRWKSQQKYRKQYRVRLRVLEMLSAQEVSRLDSTALSTDFPLQYQVSTLCS